jgi:RNA polymerase sigma-70 factor, ECF subfamily
VTFATGVSSLSDGELARRIAAHGPHRDSPAALDGAHDRADGHDGQSGSADATAAEAELVRRFSRRVRLFGLRHLKDGDAADDLTQRVLLLTLEKLRGGAVREPDQIASFVLGVARTLVREGRRGGRTFVRVDDEGTELPVQLPEEEDYLALTMLARCLQQLAERERAVMVLTYYRDAAPGEISRSLGMAGGHVRVVRHRALGRLRQCMGLEPRQRDGHEVPA